MHEVTISKVAILGIAVGALVILLMILVAACRPYNPAPFLEGSLDKPGAYLSLTETLSFVLRKISQNWLDHFYFVRVIALNSGNSTDSEIYNQLLA